MKKMGREVAIVGVGRHPWGAFPDKYIAEMGVEALVKALENANMEWKEIDAMVAGAYHWIADREGLNGLLSATAIQTFMGLRGIPGVNVANACATSGAVMREAYLTVASGMHDVVLAIGADKSGGGFFGPQSKDVKHDRDLVRFLATGETNPAYWGMEMKRRMHEVGTTEEDIALPKVLTSKASVHNEYARYRKAFTLEEVLNSPMVCDPLRLYEISATNDGAAAVILTTLDKAKKYTKKPLLIEGVSLATSSFGDQTIPLYNISTFPKPGVPFLTESRNAAKAVYEMAGRKPEDIDIIDIPDNSPWHYFVYLEVVLGLEPKEIDAMVRRGDTDPIDGKIPVCPGGGASAAGEALTAQGLYGICELVEQLKGEAGKKQVKKDAKVAYAQTYGYAGNNGACIFSRAW